MKRDQELLCLVSVEAIKPLQIGIFYVIDTLFREASKNMKGVEFKRANALNLPFEAGSYDHVFTIAALEVIEDRDRVMGEIKRVLKRCGSLFAG